MGEDGRGLKEVPKVSVEGGDKGAREQEVLRAVKRIVWVIFSDEVGAGAHMTMLYKSQRDSFILSILMMPGEGPVTSPLPEDEGKSILPLFYFLLGVFFTWGVYKMSGPYKVCFKHKKKSNIMFCQKHVLLPWHPAPFTFFCTKKKLYMLGRYPAESLDMLEKGKASGHPLR